MTVTEDGTLKLTPKELLAVTVGEKVKVSLLRNPPNKAKVPE